MRSLGGEEQEKNKNKHNYMSVTQTKRTPNKTIKL